MGGMSYWDHPLPVRRARAVDSARIAAAAIELLDAGGLPALTVRAVATRLGVAPASLYSRVRSVDDMADLALDHALRADETLTAALDGADIHQLMTAYFRHLTAHPWAGQVIAARPPRGPAYLQLSEAMVTRLVEKRYPDPLGLAYSLSNLVIGSALTASLAAGERAVSVDAGPAAVYAELHARHAVDPEEILDRALRALLRQ